MSTQSKKRIVCNEVLFMKTTMLLLQEVLIRIL